MAHSPLLLAAPLLLATFLSGCGGSASLLPSCDVPEAQTELAGALEDYGMAPTVDVVTNRGTFALEIFVAKVPITGKNFLDLASSGFYEDVKFHRVIDGFMIQGGDPNTKDDAAVASWGEGGPGYDILDEFHPELRHGGAGVLSMANSGPNTGGSQFFITLASTAHLDDKHAIFGHVTEGMEVVEEIGSTEKDSSDRPLSPVIIESMTVVPDEGAVPDSAPSLGILPASAGSVAGGIASFVLLPTGGDAPVTGAHLSVASSGGWQAEVEDCFATFVLPAGQRFAAVAAVKVPSGEAAGGSHSVTFRLEGNGHTVEATGTVHVVEGADGPAATSGRSVNGNYIGLTINGALFDTSVLAVADNDSLYPFEPVFRRKADAQYQPFTFQVDGQVVDGFSNLVRDHRAGESVASRIAPADAYGESGSAPLAGRTLIFWLDVLSVA